MWLCHYRVQLGHVSILVSTASKSRSERLPANQRALYAYVNCVLTEQNDYAYAAAVPTSAQAYAHAWAASEDWEEWKAEVHCPFQTNCIHHFH